MGPVVILADYGAHFQPALQQRLRHAGSKRSNLASGTGYKDGLGVFHVRDSKVTA